MYPPPLPSGAAETLALTTQCPGRRRRVSALTPAKLCPDLSTSKQPVPRSAGQAERVLGPPLPRRRAAATGAVGLARSLDPQEGVHQGIARAGRRRGANPLTGGIAPVARSCGVLAVAAGID